MPRKSSAPPPIELRVFKTPDEIDRAIAKLNRRIEELAALDVQDAVVNDSGVDDVVTSNIAETIREVFGTHSPEFSEHQHIRIWAGPMRIGMSKQEIFVGTQAGLVQVRNILLGLIARLKEKREDLVGGSAPRPS